MCAPNPFFPYAVCLTVILPWKKQLKEIIKSLILPLSVTGESCAHTQVRTLSLNEFKERSHCGTFSLQSKQRDENVQLLKPRDIILTYSQCSERRGSALDGSERQTCMNKAKESAVMEAEAACSRTWLLNLHSNRERLN